MVSFNFFDNEGMRVVNNYMFIILFYNNLKLLTKVLTKIIVYVLIYIIQYYSIRMTEGE